MRSLGKIARDRTTIIIAHRLSTIINADQIIVLDKGQIVENGTHQDLLQNGGVYSELWSKQLNEVTHTESLEQKNESNQRKNILQSLLANDFEDNFDEDV
eukprot:NODE_41_length_34096_cov_2.002235.p32 type:complete len:100 gc:universal NODE_41_length_34096_cov_2.002235:2815-3114(+)